MPNKHQSRGRRASLRIVARVALAAVREQQAIGRAAKRMPRPVPWEWAQPRLLPLLAGPCLDVEGEALIRAVGEPGCAVVFGLDLGGVFSLVDAQVSER